jgi:hypothetical protein
LEGDKLILINSPTISPENLTKVMSNIASWDLVKYEYWFAPKDYKKNFMLKSKFLSFILYLFNNFENRLNHDKDKNKNNVYSLGKEPAQLSLRIIQEFKRDVEARGANFLVVYLPWKEDLSLILNRKQLLFSELLKKLEESVTVIHVEKNMLNHMKEGTPASLFDGHYSSEGNRVIADTISQFILSQKQLINKKTAW